MTSQNVITKPSSSKFVPNISTDRCDASECGARANARVTLPGSGQLLFCGHHTNELKNSFPEGTDIDMAVSEDLA